MILPTPKKLSVLILIALVFLVQVFRPDIVFAESAKTRVGLVALLVDEKLLTDNEVASRIMRYSEDGQRALPGSKFIPLKVSSDIDAHQLQQVLEKLYFEGDGTRAEYNKLIGVVLIGDIPLPVVRTIDEMFPSVYPYTDFIEKAYIYNARTDTFEKNDLSTNPTPEIWHGIIKPPKSGADGMKMLKEYFDRNHNFYTKSSDAHVFDHKVFYADFYHLKEWLLPELLTQYEDRVAHMEDETYLRYTGELASRLMSGQIGQLETDGMPDIFSSHVIKTIWKEFYDTAKKYVLETNSFIENSGRWTSSDVDTPVSIISKKDRLSAQVIYRISGIYEQAIDRISDSLQRPVVLIDSYASEFQQVAAYVNGERVTNLSSAEDCTLILGSGSDIPGSQLVEANRLYNPRSAADTSGFAGCDARNIQNRAACNPDNSTRPVRDITGTQKLTNREAADFHECLDRVTVKSVPDNALQVNYRQIPSVIRHNEPRAETLRSQLDAGYSKFLPIDAVRYLTFQGGSGDLVKIDYLTNDLWKIDAISIQDAKQMIRKVIEQKNQEIISKTIQENLNAFRAYIDSRKISDFNTDNLFAQWKSQTIEQLRNFFPQSITEESLWESYMRSFDSLSVDQRELLQSIYVNIFGSNTDPVSMSPCEDANCPEARSSVHRNFRTLHDFIAGNGDTVSHDVRSRPEILQNGQLSVRTISLPPEIFRAARLLGPIALMEILRDDDISLLAEAIVWKNLSVEKKNAFILEHYLGSGENRILDKSIGYEAAYIIASGDATSIDVSVGKGLKEIYDKEFSDLKRIADSKRSLLLASASLDTSTEELPDKLRCPNGNGDAVDVFLWLPYLKCWLEETISPPFFSLASKSNDQIHRAAIEDGADAAAAAYIGLSSDHEYFDTASDEPVHVTAKLYDKNGRSLKQNNALKISLRTTAASKEFFSFEPSVSTNSGIASFVLTPKNVGVGELHLIAEADGLIPATFVLPIQSRMSFDQIKAIQPNALYTTFLGAPVGDITQEDYLGGWMLFKGRGQALTASLRGTEKHPSVFAIGQNSYLSLSNDAKLRYQSVGSDSFEVLDAAGEKIANVRFVTSSQIPIHFIAGDQSEQDFDSGILFTPSISSGFSFAQENQQVLITSEDGQVHATVGPGFDFDIKDPLFTIERSEVGNELSFDIKNGPVVVATILSKVSFPSIRMGVPKSGDSEGIYLENLGNRYISEQIFTGSSTHGAKGFALTDSTQKIPAEYGFTSEGIQDVFQKPGIGWTGDYKNMLQYASGSSVGGAVKSYASDIEVLLGDPLISLRMSGYPDPTSASPRTDFNGYLANDLGFDLTTGENIMHETASPIIDNVILDFNNDSVKDVISVLSNGTVKLYRGITGDASLEPLGTFFRFPGKPDQIISADFSRDRYDDVIGLVDGKLLLFNNVQKRINDVQLDFDQKRITSIASDDMNRDSYPDLIFSNSKGEVYVSYGSSRGLQPKITKIYEFGVRVKESDNLSATLLLYYPGMKSAGSDGSDDSDYQEITYIPAYEKTIRKNTEQAVSIDSDTPRSQNYVSFLRGDRDKNLLVEKKLKRADGSKESLDIGDTLRVSLTLTNKTKSRISSLTLFDTINGAYAFKKNSVVCDTCKDANGKSLAPAFGIDSSIFVFDGITLKPGEALHIAYDATVQNLPTMSTYLGYFDRDSGIRNSEDRYLDIMLKPRASDGLLIYLVSRDGESYIPRFVTPDNIAIPGAENQMKSRSDMSLPEANKFSQSTLDSMKKDSDGDRIPDMIDPFFDLQPRKNIQGNAGLVPSAFAQGDGSDANIIDLSFITDTAKQIMDTINDELGATASIIESVLKVTFCSGGCLALPVNVAFLAPGPINVLGASAGFDPGQPVFWDTIFLGLPPQSSTLRLYISPTTTLSAAFSICYGAIYGAPCWTIPIPVSAAFSEFCAEISGGAKEVLATFNNARATLLRGSDLGVVRLDAASGQRRAVSENTIGLEYGLQSNESFNFDEYSGEVKNKSIPSFPDFFSGWLDKQWEEIANSFSDLPDIIVYYPDFENLAPKVRAQFEGATANLNVAAQNTTLTPDNGSLLSMDKIIKALSFFPFLDVKVENIVLRIPWIDARELQKVEADFQLWVLDEIQEVTKFLDSLSGLTCGLISGSEEFIASKEYEAYLAESQRLSDVQKSAKSLPDKVEAMRTLVAYKSKFMKDEWNRKMQNTTNSKAQTESKKGQCLAARFSIDLLAALDQFFASIDQNLERIDSYRELPKKLVEYYNLTGQFLKNVAEFLDSFFGTFTKWIRANVDRSQLWIKQIYRFEEYAQLWKNILNITADYKANCSMCKNDRFSLKELLMKLFVVLPELPIVPIPNWPDIILDFSSIKAGVPVTIPNLKVVPESIPNIIPKLPRISLPDLASISIGVGADLAGSVSIPGIPVLPPIPEFPEINFQLPEIPKLKLPIVPLPPKLPDIFPWLISVSDTLQIVFKVVCLLDQAAIPVQEAMLKTQVENLTQRPLEPLLPIDLGLALSAKPLPFLSSLPDFLKVTTKINFRPRMFDIITSEQLKILQSFVSSSNSIVSDIIQGSSRMTQQFSDYISKSASAVVEQAKEGARLIPNIDVKIDTQSSLVPDYISLPDAERYISSNPLIASLPEVSQILREAGAKLSDYSETDDLRDMIALGGGFMNDTRLAAFSEGVHSVKAENVSSDRSGDTEIIQKRTPLFADTMKTLAQAAGNAASSQSNVALEGLYITSNNTLQKLVNHSDATSQNSNVLMHDFDGDGDLDVLYASGNDLYLKKSYLKREKPYYYSRKPVMRDAKDFFPKSSSIDMFRSASRSSLRLEWLRPSASDDPTYTVSLYDTIDGSESNKPLKDFVLTPEDPENPSVILDLPDGHYYAKLTTQDYLDAYQAIPDPVVSSASSEEFIPIFTERQVDGLDIIDTESGHIWWDLDLSVDSDSDGDPTNDRDRLGSLMTFGPYNSVGVHNVMLNSDSSSGDVVQSKVSMHVFVPKISISESDLLSSRQIRGVTEPPVPFFPVGIVRERGGVTQVLTDGSQDGKYFTNALGEFALQPFTETSGYHVYGPEGYDVAKVLQDNGRIVLSAEAQDIYNVSLKNPSDLPVSLNLLNSARDRFIAVYFMPEVDTDVTLHDLDFDMLSQAPGLHGVHVKIESRDYLFEALAGDSGIYPGSIDIKDASQNSVATITPRGIVVLHDANTTLRVHDYIDEAEPVLFEIIRNNSLIATIYIASDFSNIQKLKVRGLQDREASTQAQLSSPAVSTFTDVPENSPYFEPVNRLIREGIVRGYADNTFRPLQPITRAEFLKIVLGSINCQGCEGVSESVKDEFDPVKNNPDLFSFNGVAAEEAGSLAYNIASLNLNTLFHYPDVLISDWFYYCVEIATKLGIVQGYKGESDTGQNARGLFLPQENISRAEAVKVYIEAAKFPISRSDRIYDTEDEQGQNIATAWYYAPDRNYIQTAVGLNLLTSDASGRLYPERKITRGEMAEMAVKVLEKLRSNFPDTDFDSDNIRNTDDQCMCVAGEIRAGDPFNGCPVIPEQQGMPVIPGVLLPEKTPGLPESPLPSENSAITPASPLDPGIYILEDDNLCQKVEPIAPAIDSDLFYAIISDRSNEKVWRESNKVIYQP